MTRICPYTSFICNESSCDYCSIEQEQQTFTRILNKEMEEHKKQYSTGNASQSYTICADDIQNKTTPLVSQKISEGLHKISELLDEIKREVKNIE